MLALCLSYAFALLILLNAFTYQMARATALAGKDSCAVELCRIKFTNSFCLTIYIKSSGAIA